MEVDWVELKSGDRSKTVSFESGEVEVNVGWLWRWSLESFREVRSPRCRASPSCLSASAWEVDCAPATSAIAPVACLREQLAARSLGHGLSSFASSDTCVRISSATSLALASATLADGCVLSGFPEAFVFGSNTAAASGQA